mmetsp:Transcript_11932/g.43640  ORF Transcript_11932/g.43640 Transcript_11932/m.43640 type:complete len:204 (+) Transcript_11932:1365-1976(+)
MFAPLSFLALSYFSLSALPLMSEFAASHTYLWSLPFMVSFQPASQVTVLSQITRPQSWPGIGHLGITASAPMFMVMSSGMILFFSLPILGCSPRPLKRPGGSTRKLPTCCGLPSTRAILKGCSSFSFSCFSFSLASLSMVLLSSDCFSTCSWMGPKSHLFRSLMMCFLPRTSRKSAQKFSLKRRLPMSWPVVGSFRMPQQWSR